MNSDEEEFRVDPEGDLGAEDGHMRDMAIRASELLAEEKQEGEFDQINRYNAVKVSESDLQADLPSKPVEGDSDSDIYEDDIDMEDQEDEEAAAAPVEEDDDVEELDDLEEEDKKFSEKVKENTQGDIDRAEAVKVQQKIYENLLFQRILCQKAITKSNKLESNTEEAKDLETALENNIKSLIEAQASILNEEAPSSEDLFSAAEEQFTQFTLPYCQDQIDRWNSKTQVQAQINKGKKAKAQTSAPTHERDEEEESKQVYDDNLFYSAMLKEFVSQNETAEVDQETANTLNQREKNAVTKTKNAKKREYERGASKSRKIKYSVHEKLVNFIEPEGVQGLLEQRGDILRNMFGVMKPVEADEDDDEEMGVTII